MSTRKIHLISRFIKEGFQGNWNKGSRIILHNDVIKACITVFYANVVYSYTIFLWCRGGGGGRWDSTPQDPGSGLIPDTVCENNKRQVREKPLYLLRTGHGYHVLFMGGKSSFAPPLPYLWSSARAAHYACFSTDEQLCLPGNWITNEENSCYPNSLLPGTFGIGP